MNVSAVNTFLPEIVRKDPVTTDTGTGKNVHGTKQMTLLSDSDRGSTRRYSYYIVSDETETVYTRQRVTEKISAAAVGRLVDVFV